MKLFLTTLSLSILLVLTRSVPCPAASISPIEGLEVLRKAFAGTSDFSAEIVQEKQLTIMKRVLTTHGTVRFRKPDLFFMEIKPPYASKLLLKDNVVEQMNPRDHSRNRIILPTEQSLVKWFDKLSSPVTRLPEGLDIKADKNGPLYSLQIMPVKRGQLRRLTLSYQADGIIRKIIIEEHNGNRSTITLNRFRKNSGLTEADLSL